MVDQEVVAVLRDVSDRKTQESAVEAARSDSERASAGKSRFIATMSHELRTPLNAIIGFSEMLMNRSLEINPSRQLEYVKLVNESGRHLLSVVNGILDASKIEAGHFEITREPLAPAPVIENCAELLALNAREIGIELKLRVAQNLPEILADRHALSQILINLISNAVKFTPHGGCVTLGASSDGTKLAMTVEDTGVGIEKDDLPRVGEAFFQARTSYDRRYDGTGLGLSIVKGLVKLHGGDVEIWSGPGKGTRVTVRLPLSHGAGRTPVEPVKLVTETSRDIRYAANDWVKKSA